MAGDWQPTSGVARPEAGRMSLFPSLADPYPRPSL